MGGGFCRGKAGGPAGGRPTSLSGMRIDVLTKAHPDVDLFCAAKDEKLNENCYILPGLGDAGDRIYGTDVVGEVSVDKRGSTVKLHSKIKY